MDLRFHTTRHRSLAAVALVAGICSLILLTGAERFPPDLGSGWQALDDGLLPHVTVTALAVDPQDPLRVYVGTTGPDGLWLSADGGGSGRFAGGAMAGRVPFALVIDPARPEQVYAATDAGLYRSADAGRTWQPESGLPAMAYYALVRESDGTLLAGGAGAAVYRCPAADQAAWQRLASLPDGGTVLSLAASPGGATLLAGTDGAGLFRSDDGGRTWQQAPEIEPTYVAALVFGPDGQAFARTRLGLFASADGEASSADWRQTAGDVPGRIDAVTIAGPAGDVFLGTSEGALYRRDPASDRWQPWGKGIGRPGLFSSLQIAPAQPTRWYAGTGNGLYISDDSGLNWRVAAPGPGRVSAAVVAIAADALYMGNADGVYRSTDGGLHWEPRSDGLPDDTVLALGLSPAEPELLYAGLAGQGVYRSEDGGQHWTATGWTRHGAPGLVVDPADPRHLYIRVTYERVYESNDGGATWTARWDGLGLSTQVISLAMDPLQPETLYAGSTEGFFRSTDGGKTWQSAGPELAGQTVFSIAVDSRKGGDLYAGATNGIYRSQDGGEHWERLGSGLEDVTVTAVAFDRQRPDVMYAGTGYQGVFVSVDAGSHWQYAGPEPVSVNSLGVSPDGQWLYAATGDGFFRRGMP